MHDSISLVYTKKNVLYQQRKNSVQTVKETHIPPVRWAWNLKHKAVLLLWETNTHTKKPERAVNNPDCHFLKYHVTLKKPYKVNMISCMPGISWIAKKSHMDNQVQTKNNWCNTAHVKQSFPTSLINKLKRKENSHFVIPSTLLSWKQFFYKRSI